MFLRVGKFFFLSFFLLFPFAAAGLSVPGTGSVSIQDLKKAIREFSAIDAQLFRGGQPSLDSLKLLKDFGIRTVINFRHEREEIEKERIDVERLGMRYISLPWRIQWRPRKPVMRQFLEIVTQKENGPFFIHCRRGAERTGVADALYRHYILGMSREEAWEKSTEGFNRKCLWKPFTKWRLNDFYKTIGTRHEYAARKNVHEATNIA